MGLRLEDFETSISQIRSIDLNHKSNGIISIFNSHLEAEEAIKQLQESGFDMRKLSLIGKDYQSEEKIIGFYNIGNRAIYWGEQGAFWGSIWGLLFGSAFFVIPGVGPIVIAGAFVSTIVGAIEGAIVVGGLSAIGAALFSIGIPKNSIIEYETAIKANKYVMIAHGSKQDLINARNIVQNNGALDIASIDAYP